MDKELSVPIHLVEVLVYWWMFKMGGILYNPQPFLPSLALQKIEHYLSFA